MELKCKFIESKNNFFLISIYIYRHEGRSWYTPHRGRLWIHAAAKDPEQDVISQMEEFYTTRNTGIKK